MAKITAAESELRVQALHLALGSGGASTSEIVTRAQNFYDFLAGSSSTAVAAATQVSTPVADEEPPRLDDPAVVAETAETLAEVGSSPEPVAMPDPTPAVIESPTLQGDATTAPDASSTSSPASADASSSAAQPTADALPAEQSPPKPVETTVGDPVVQTAGDNSAIDLTRVQAAVLAANKALGRDATVAILAANGGDRLPSVPVANHRALFVELNAALAAAGKDQVAE